MNSVMLALLVFLLAFNVEQIKGQNEVLSCIYSQYSYYGYICDLTIINPNGLNNFQDISGTHINGKTDNDVTYVSTTSESKSTNIPSIICRKFQNLVTFDFDYSNITEINDYYFVNCKNLYSLSIGGTTINKVYKNSFFENINFQSLSLTGCGLTDLPANVFPKLGNNLTFLSLEGNNLKVIKPGWFQSMTNLESLSFENNLIEEIPINTFINCKKLTHLTMSHNKLKVISSKSFYDIPETYYSFSYNFIEAIDEKFVKDMDPVYQYRTLTNNWCVIERAFTTPTEGDFSICIENYLTWENGCALGNTNGRICNLENDIIGLQAKIDAVTKENQDLKSKVDILTIAVQAMQMNRQ